MSDAALTTRPNAARTAIGNSGEQQHLIRTLPRKGFRFVGPVLEAQEPAAAAVPDNTEELLKPALTLPDNPRSKYSLSQEKYYARQIPFDESPIRRSNEC